MPLAEDWQSGGFGLYVHWPFCQAKCPYCDFNSHVTGKVDHRRWRDAYLREIDRYAALLPGRVLNSVFLGGGTPSLMAPDTVHDILEHVRQVWPVANDLEVTLEANPGSVEAGRFAAFAQADGYALRTVQPGDTLGAVASTRNRFRQSVVTPCISTARPRVASDTVVRWVPFISNRLTRPPSATATVSAPHPYIP